MSWNICRSLAGMALSWAALSAAAKDVAEYRGLCDASAAVALGPQHFVVADDERDVLTVYRRGKAKAVDEVDLAEALGARHPRGKPKEADIEGAAMIGARIYWITSHGRDSGGDVEPSRWRLFATEAVSRAGLPSLRPLATPAYDGLLRALVAEPRLVVFGLATASQKAPEDPQGLNIEGLAATPSGGLLIGFRNPRPAGKALIVPLQNPREVVDAAAAPLFGEALLLDLGGRGIRSIERIGTRYVIVAGAFDDGDDFALFTWSGRASDAPVLIRDAPLGKLRPEALFAWPDSDRIQLLSDDGGRRVDGQPCKDKAVPVKKKSFRSIEFTLPRERAGQ